MNFRTHNGTMTIRSRVTGEHRTLRCSTEMWEDGKPHRVVGLLIGPDNTHDYLAFAFAGFDGIRVWPRYADNKVYQWLAKAAAHPEDYTNQAEFLEEGRCRRCNRLLTNPESIASGLGDVCRSKWGE